MCRNTQHTTYSTRESFKQFRSSRISNDEEHRPKHFIVAFGVSLIVNLRRLFDSVFVSTHFSSHCFFLASFYPKIGILLLSNEFAEKCAFYHFIHSCVDADVVNSCFSSSLSVSFVHTNLHTDRHTATVKKNRPFIGNLTALCKKPKERTNIKNIVRCGLYWNECCFQRVKISEREKKVRL